MRRTVVLVGVWLLVAAGAVAVAWQGVSVVADQVTDERPASLAAADIEQRLAEPTTTITTTSTSAGATSSSAPAPGSTPTTSGGGPGADPGTAASSTTAPPPAPTTTAAGETRTYNLTGGTAALRFGPAGVTVVFANPAPGFAVTVEPDRGNGVKVEFESPTHESRVEGWWEGGPVDRVRDEAED